jgi:hypothetical protein
MAHPALYHIDKWRLTELALQIFPYIRVNSGCFLAVPFSMQPLFDAAKTNILH